MIEITIPGFQPLRLQHLVLDYNGTLSCDGRLIEGVRERMTALASDMELHLLTADTFGSVAEEVSGIPCRLSIIGRENQAEAKAEVVRGLGAGECVAVGNGRNDRLMLEEATLGIALIQAEGASAETLATADIVCTSILDALDLLTHPLRLVATLRS